MKIAKFMQIVMKNGFYHQIGCNGKEEYKKRKIDILNARTDFIDVIDTLSVRKSEISSIEYFEREVDENAESNPDPTK